MTHGGARRGAGRPDRGPARISAVLIVAMPWEFMPARRTNLACTTRIWFANFNVVRRRKIDRPMQQDDLDRHLNRFGHLARKPLSDNEIDDRLKAARELLGNESESETETKEGFTTLESARRALELLSLALIKIGIKRQPTL